MTSYISPEPERAKRPPIHAANPRKPDVREQGEDEPTMLVLEDMAERPKPARSFGEGSQTCSTLSRETDRAGGV
jgi:hypothetical protein